MSFSYRRLCELLDYCLVHRRVSGSLIFSPSSLKCTVSVYSYRYTNCVWFRTIMETSVRWCPHPSRPPLLHRRYSGLINCVYTAANSYRCLAPANWSRALLLHCSVLCSVPFPPALGPQPLVLSPSHRTPVLSLHTLILLRIAIYAPSPSLTRLWLHNDRHTGPAPGMISSSQPNHVPIYTLPGFVPVKSFWESSNPH